MPQQEDYTVVLMLPPGIALQRYLRTVVGAACRIYWDGETVDKVENGIRAC